MEQLRRDILKAGLRNIAHRREPESPQMRNLKARYGERRISDMHAELTRNTPTEHPAVKALAEVLNPRPFGIHEGNPDKIETFMPIEIKGKLTAEQLTEAAQKAGLEVKATEQNRFFTITHPAHKNFQIRARFNQEGKSAGRSLKTTRNPRESRSAPQEHPTRRAMAISHYRTGGLLTAAQRGHIMTFLHHVNSAAKPTIKPRRTK